jgi:hypothetical protein
MAGKPYRIGYETPYLITAGSAVSEKYPTVIQIY